MRRPGSPCRTGPPAVRAPVPRPTLPRAAVTPAPLTWWALVLAAAIPGSSARVEALQPGVSFTARDSAGIRIVENAAPVLTGDARWRLDPTPALSVGGDGADTVAQLGDLLLVGRLSDGEIVTVDGTQRRIRYHSPVGRFLRAIGRAGRGPGEFTAPFHSAGMCGDSVLIRLADRPGRILVISPRPAMARVIDPPAASGPRTPLADGCAGGRPMSVLARPHGAAAMGGSPAGGSDPGIRLARMDLEIVGDGGRALGLIRDVELEAYSTRVDGVRSAISVPAPFARRLSVAVGEAGTWVTSKRSYEVTLYAADGSPRLLVRAEHQPRRITSMDRDRVLRAALNETAADSTRAALRAALSDPGLPDTFPAIGGILVDADDNLWVREYDAGDMLLPDREAGGSPPPGPAHTRRWAVFAPDGQMLTHVITPPRFTVTRVGRDWVLGVRHDEGGAQSALLYRLRK